MSIESLMLYNHLIGEGDGSLLQCSCLENPRDGGAWWAAVYGVAQSRTPPKRLSSSSNHLILCCPLLFLPSIFPSIRVFSNESALCIRWPEYWSFSFSISPSNEYSWLISFRIDRFDLLAVQGTLKNLLQHHSSKASIIQCSAFIMVQLSHLYRAAGKTIALIVQTFVGQVMSLLFNILFRFVIGFLPRSMCLLISGLQSPSAVILEPKRICHCFYFFCFYLSQSDGTRCHDLSFKPAFSLSSFTSSNI